MESRRKKALESWLATERKADEGMAERALFALWKGLDRPAPSAGFARRAMARAGLRRTERRRRLRKLPVPAWAPRAALAAALALVAVSTTLVPVSLVTVARAGDRLAGGAVGLLTAVSERLAHGLTAWNVATQISNSLVAGLDDPSVLAALGGSMLMSLFAFGWLTQLLALERSTKHA